MGESDIDASSLHELIRRAQEHALLDDWRFDNSHVWLSLGTFEINLDAKTASSLLRSMLRAIQVAKEISRK